MYYIYILHIYYICTTYTTYMLHILHIYFITLQVNSLLTIDLFAPGFDPGASRWAILGFRQDAFGCGDPWGDRALENGVSIGGS